MVFRCRLSATRAAGSKFKAVRRVDSVKSARNIPSTIIPHVHPLSGVKNRSSKRLGGALCSIALRYTLIVCSTTERQS